MQIIRSIEAMQAFAKGVKQSGERIGFVPTMGFLHEGHLSLVDRAKSEADVIVVSIFVNPTQFGPNEDLDAYPRDFARDEALCAGRGVDVVFYPPVEAMYFSDHSCWVEEFTLSQNLCGASRPSHFRGVTTVVAKLFNAVLPDVAVFGQKDAQQYLVLERMVRDLNFPIKMIRGEIVREADGLAMSSRNKYLSEKDRQAAVAISQALFQLKRRFLDGETAAAILLKAVEEAITTAGGRMDYVEAVSAETMQSVETLTENCFVAVAAFFGQTRLIDNVFFD